MNRLNVWTFALAAAATFAALSWVCAIAVIISPDVTIAVFNNWFHGLDLKLLVPPGGRPVTAGQHFARWNAGGAAVCKDHPARPA